MKSFKPIIISAAFLASCQAIGSVHANKQEPPHSATPANQIVEGHETRKQYKPEDYWIPLDNWLKWQGSPLSGKDVYEVATEYNLDPDFLIAVTKAETNLGKVTQRGSQYNIGSVGSFDSTSTTYGAGSHREGLRLIAATVNNQLLGKYTKISELSRSHNKNQAPVYATSDGNWFRNVRDTMNALKGKQEPDFLFRRQ